MNKIWKCQQCNVWHNWVEAQPSISTLACVFYGDYGLPPFSNSQHTKTTKPGYNNSPLIAKFNYCKNCS